MDNRLILTSQGKRASIYSQKEKTMTNINSFGFDNNPLKERILC